MRILDFQVINKMYLILYYIIYHFIKFIKLFIFYKYYYLIISYAEINMDIYYHDSQMLNRKNIE